MNQERDPISLTSDKLTTINSSNVGIMMSPNFGASEALTMLQKADAKGGTLGDRFTAAMRLSGRCRHSLRLAIMRSSFPERELLKSARLA
jgi:hypothetical protein